MRPSLKRQLLYSLLSAILAATATKFRVNDGDRWKFLRIQRRLFRRRRWCASFYLPDRERLDCWSTDIIALSIGREHTCRPDVSWNDDLPPNFATNETHLCGVTWPQATPLQNISICCSEGSPVEVSHACFQYCETDTEPIDFQLCARRVFAPKVFGTRCNFNPEDTGSGHSTSLWMLWPFIGCLAVLALILLGVSMWRRCRTSRTIGRLSENEPLLPSS